MVVVVHHLMVAVVHHKISMVVVVRSKKKTSAVAATHLSAKRSLFWVAPTRACPWAPPARPWRRPWGWGRGPSASPPEGHRKGKGRQRWRWATRSPEGSDCRNWKKELWRGNCRNWIYNKIIQFPGGILELQKWRNKKRKLRIKEKV